MLWRMLWRESEEVGVPDVCSGLLPAFGKIAKILCCVNNCRCRLGVGEVYSVVYMQSTLSFTAKVVVEVAKARDETLMIQLRVKRTKLQ